VRAAVGGNAPPRPYLIEINPSNYQTLSEANGAVTDTAKRGLAATVWCAHGFSAEDSRASLFWLRLGDFCRTGG